jgi:hypothetical protein
LKEALALDARLNSHKDRVSFSKKFFQTWSPQKSLPAWVKRPQRWRALVQESLKSDPSDFGWGLNNIKILPKNWTGVEWVGAREMMDTAGQFSNLIDVQENMEKLNEAFGFNFNTLKIGRKRRFMESLNLSRKTASFRDECDGPEEFQEVWLRTFWECVDMWSNITPILYPMIDRNGKWIQKLQKAIKQDKAHVLVGMHDLLAEAMPIVNEFGGKGTQAAIDHHGSPSVDLIKEETCNCDAEYKLLVTPEDFNKEAVEMKHCIGLYFLEHKGHHFLSMRRFEDGERSSVALHIPRELGIPWKMYQHYGPSNQIPTVLQRMELKKHLTECIDLTT